MGHYMKLRASTNERISKDQLKKAKDIFMKKKFIGNAKRLALSMQNSISNNPRVGYDSNLLKKLRSERQT